MESFFAGLIGFLVGKGVAPADAQSIVKALETYLGFEPPVGLAGFALQNMVKGKKYKASVVVRGKTYDVHALDHISKYSQISVLGKKGAYLEVAPIFKTVTREKGEETRVAFYTAQVAPAGSVVLLNLKGQDVTLEVVEFATEYDACKIVVEAYNATGGLTDTLSVLDTAGGGKFPVAPIFIHTHESILWYELIYDTTTPKFKFGLGHSVRFANGCKVSIGNPTIEAPKWINCMVVASVRG